MKKIFLPSLSPYRSINAKCSQCNSTTTFSGFMRVRMESEINNYPEYQCQSCGKLKFSNENLTLSNENDTKDELLIKVALNEFCECGGQYRRDKNIFCPNCLSRHNPAENKCDLNLLFIRENEFEKLSNS